MINDPQKIADALFEAVGEGESLYVILDAARTFDIPFRLRSAPVEQASLYCGRNAQTLWHVAPYLIRCERESEFFQWVLAQGWGDSWGIFLISTANLENLREHFRKFLLVTIEDEKEGKEVYFRFYDPRVLRVFLPSWTPQETTEFFGPVRYYLMEGKKPDTLLKFTDSETGLKQDAGTLSAPEQAETEHPAKFL